MTNRKSRPRLGAQWWSQTLERQRDSGLGVALFCRQQGISASNFYRWREVLKRPASAAPRPRKAPSSRAHSGFVDLGPLHGQTLAPACTPSEGACRLNLRIELGGGLVLHLERH